MEVSYLIRIGWSAWMGLIIVLVLLGFSFYGWYIRYKEAKKKNEKRGLIIFLIAMIAFYIANILSIIKSLILIYTL